MRRSVKSEAVNREIGSTLALALLHLRDLVLAADCTKWKNWFAQLWYEMRESSVLVDHEENTTYDYVTRAQDFVL